MSISGLFPDWATAPSDSIRAWLGSPALTAGMEGGTTPKSRRKWADRRRQVRDVLDSWVRGRQSKGAGGANRRRVRGSRGRASRRKLHPPTFPAGSGLSPPRSTFTVLSLCAWPRLPTLLHIRVTWGSSDVRPHLKPRKSQSVGGPMCNHPSDATCTASHSRGAGITGASLAGSVTRLLLSLSSQP